MRALFLALGLVLTLAPPAQAQITLVVGQTATQTDSAVFNDATHTISLPSAATAGNLIVVTVTGTANVSVTGIDDSGTTVYAEAVTSDQAGPGRARIWWGIAAGAGAGQSIVITESATDASAHVSVAVMEFTSSGGSLSDQTNRTTNSATGTSPTVPNTGSVTPATANNVVIGVFKLANGTHTDDATFTTVINHARHQVGYKIQSSASATSYSTGSGADFAGAIAAFVENAAAAGGSPQQNRMLIRGVQ